MTWTTTHALSDQLTATVPREPTLGQMEEWELQKDARREGASTSRRILDATFLALAICVQSWDGKDAPTLEQWPALTGDAALEARLTWLRKADLPARAAANLARTIMRAMTLSEDDAKNSEPPSA